MTLREKLFDAVFDNAWEFKTKNVIPQCEQIAEEFAIGFAEWFHENCYEDNVGYYRAEELLEIYKKTL